MSIETQHQHRHTLLFTILLSKMIQKQPRNNPFGSVREGPIYLHGMVSLLISWHMHCTC